jgi:hypothetical protein
VIALDLLTLEGEIRINGKPIVAGPRALTIANDNGEHVDYVEWYTGSDDPEALDYTRVLVRADVRIKVAS